MTGFFQELKRRKVYRVAIAYIVASWALAQGLAQVLPVFDIQNSTIRIVIALMLIGFPVALVLAWMFDVTPQGIKATPSAGPPKQIRRNLFLLLGVGVIISAAAGAFVFLPRAVARKVDKSIAVLPFESLSEDKENAYFADGIQDDILTSLSKIGDLRVISRTSVMGYRDKTPSVREIGKTLGVSNILEGSVRRSGNKVRVNVQLIDATNDRHIWANDYDRDLTDVFAIQTELAHDIANQLQAKLSDSEKAWMERKPTESDDAYLAFTRAQNLYHSSMEELTKLKEAEELFQRAIDLDPKFALAFARYAQLESWIVHSFDNTAERRAKAHDLAKRALDLRPDLAEAHGALGWVYYYVDLDFDAAAREFEIAQSGLPNESEAYLALGAIQRRQGKWSESNANFEKAVSLNPKDIFTIQNLAINYEMQRNWTAANATVDRALAVNPNALSPLELKGKFAVEEKGDTEFAKQLLAKIDQLPLSPDMQTKIAGDRIQLYVLLRQFDDAARTAQALPDELLSKFPGALTSKYLLLGQTKKIAGDTAAAQNFLLKAKSLAQEELRQSPEDANAHARLAETLAWLGEKEAAFAEIKQAQDLLPVTKDAFSGPDILQTAAQIQALCGDASLAISILDDLLQRPSPVTTAILKIHPVWDPIRKDPRFQALIDKYSAKA